MVNFLRPKATWKRFGVGRTTFYGNYVWHEGGDPYIPGTQVLRLKPPAKLGERAVGFPDDEVDTTIEAFRAERDGKLGDAAA
jgi:predicted DNA-binding transcriptional regulator AlpA